MKHKILLLLFMMGFIYTQAQVTPSFGIKAGVTKYSIKGDATENLNNILDFADGMLTTKSTMGFFAGGNVNIPLGESFSAEPGIYYTRKGYEINGELGLKGMEFLGINARAALQSHYIDVPLLLKANLGGFEIFAGPQVSYLAKADLKTTAGALGINLLNKTLDASDQFNRWDAGFTGGIGYKFDNISISAMYDHGLSKLDKNQSVDSYNRGFKVGLGINF